MVDELELRLLSTTDSLTASMTRRAFLAALKRDVALARRHGRSLTCIMVDADHSKAVNDTYGHATGDTVLRRLVSVCSAQLRTSDYIGRLGGEEFAIILREVDASAGVEIAERLRTLIARETFMAPQGLFSVTVSLGVAALENTVSDSDELLRQADAALYRAKAAGRDRTILHDRSSQHLSLV